MQTMQVRSTQLFPKACGGRSDLWSLLGPDAEKSSCQDVGLQRYVDTASDDSPESIKGSENLFSLKPTWPRHLEVSRSQTHKQV